MEELNELYNKHWLYVKNFLPEDLEKTALNDKAITRKREICSANDLLRMLLAYSIADLSLQSICAWAEAINIASISKPAFFYRVRDSTKWIINLLTYVLNTNKRSDQDENELKKIKIVDATHIQGPGATGMEWRIHTLINVHPDGKHWSMENIQISDELVGENFGVYSLNANDIVIGDRAYGIASSIFYAKEQGADVIARIYPDNIRICNLSNEVINIREYEKDVPDIELFNMDIIIPVPPGKKTKSKKIWELEKARAWIPARLIGSRNRDGEVIWIITTLSESLYDSNLIMRLYRIRWQIELLFKRLKSISWLDKLPSPHKGPTALSWIAGRLLAAALVEAINSQANIAFPPS